MRDHLEIFLLGDAAFHLNEQPIEKLTSRKATALFIYLVCNPGPVSRDRLADLFYGHLPQQRARANISVLLSRLHVLADYLQPTRHSVAFTANDDYWLDTRLLEAHLTTVSARVAADGGLSVETAALLAEALALYRGDFLAGFHVLNALGFEEWAVVERERLHRLAIEGLEQLGSYHVSAAQYQAGIEQAARLLHLDPLNEAAHRQMMNLLALNGQRNEALAHYHTCRRLLLEELEIEPSPDTTTLYEHIRSGDSGEPAPHNHPNGFLPTARPTTPPGPAILSPLLAAVPSSIRSPLPFVGRQTQLTQLDGFLEETVAGGKGQVIFITGEAGSGKTTLTQEFTRQARKRYPDLIVAAGNGNAHTGVGDPYLSFREILGLLSGDVEDRWAVNAISLDSARRLWRLIPHTVQALLDVGPDLIDTFVSGSALEARATTAMANDRNWVACLSSFLARKAAVKEQPGLKQVDLFSQYARVLEALARQHPLLLMLDDLQWADAGSINLLFRLGRQLNSTPILILGCYRPTDVALGRNGNRHPLESVVNEFQQHFGDIKVVLRQTGEKAFADALLDTQPHHLSPTFREAFYYQCRSHPLFTNEMLQVLQERGDLVRDERGRWVEGPTLDWQTLPTKIEGVIAERVGRLPEKLRRALSIASIEGETFTAEVVARGQGVAEREMVSWLSNQLDRKHRLVTGESSHQLNSSRQRVSQYRFRHILFQKYLYNSLDDAERVYLHGAVGNALEQLYGRQAGEIAVPLAWHFQTAGLGSKAIDYLEKAGEQAQHTYANQAVIDFFSRALDLDDSRESPAEHSRRAAWERQVGEAYEKLGRLTESRDHLQQALTLLGRSLPTTREKLMIGLLGQLLRQLLHRLWPTRFTRSPQDTADLLEAARVYRQLARIFYNRNEKNSAIYAGLQALNLAEQAGPSPLLALLYGSLSILIGVIPIHPLAKLYQNRALEIAQNAGHLHTSGIVLEAAGIYHLGVGRWPEAQAQLERANEIFESLGDRHRGVTSRFPLAGVPYYQGEFTQSKALFENIYTRADRSGAVLQKAWGLLGKGATMLRLGKDNEALNLLEAALPSLANTARPTKILSYGLLAVAYLRQERFQRARQAADTAMQLIAQSSPIAIFAFDGYANVTEVYLRLWETTVADDGAPSNPLELGELAHQSCQALRRFARAFPIAQPRSRLWQGGYNWLAGKPGKAHKAWQKSLVHAKRLEMPYDEGLAHYEIGRHLPLDDPARQVNLTRAIEIFTQLEAAYDLARAEEELHGKNR